MSENEPMYCSPSTEGNKGSCFRRTSLLKIARAWNKTNPGDKISLKLGDIELWHGIKKRMMRFTPGCDEDYCLLKNKTVINLNDKDINQNTFRPEAPEGAEDAWLSTLDIQAVMEQYEQKYSDFKFIGPVPIDFDNDIFPGMCVSDELCKINLKKIYKQGVRKLGIVFNLDPHYRGGSHWVCLYMDFKTGGIYYFDSVGSLPPQQIKKLMNLLKNQGNDLILNGGIKLENIDDTHTQEFKYIMGDKRNQMILQTGGNMSPLLDNIVVLKGNVLNRVTKVDDDRILLLNKVLKKQAGGGVFKSKCFKQFYNKEQFQYKDSECGVYTIHFLEEFLKGKKFNEIVTAKHTDAQMFQLRKKYFRKN